MTQSGRRPERSHVTALPQPRVFCVFQAQPRIRPFPSGVFCPHTRWGLFMRRLSATLVAIVPIFAFTHVASAADMPRKAPAYAPPPPPAISWTGWYVGLNAGGNWGTSDPATNAIPVDPSTSFFDGCINAA